jgi:hypothetical protein
MSAFGKHEASWFSPELSPAGICTPTDLSFVPSGPTDGGSSFHDVAIKKAGFRPNVDAEASATGCQVERT